jgi:ATP-dependent Clp protease ATP-binding subunit ClpX
LKAIEFKVGARGLRSILEAVMMEAMFQIPTQEKPKTKFVVTKAYVQKQLDKKTELDISQMK